MREIDHQHVKTSGAVHRRDRLLRPEAGVTLFTVTMALALFSVAALGVMGSMIKGARLNAINRETSMAAQAARAAMERVRAAPFRDALALYNDKAGDDPGGTGSAPGNNFDVSGLDVRKGDLDGMVGEIVFPVHNSGALLENKTMPELGMPRDLSGDGTVDNKDHSEDYVALPVKIRVQWTGTGGAREYQLHALLMK